MQDTESRVAAVIKRVDEIKECKRVHRSRRIGIASIAACLTFLVGLSAALPGIMGRISFKDYVYTSMSASVFAGDSNLGYMIIALTAFVLGVSVTILCCRMHLFNRKEDKPQTRQR